MCFVFVGSGKGHIHVFELEGDSRLRPRGTFAAGDNPSYLAFHPSRPYLFAVDERSPGRLRSFLVEPGTASLTPLNEVPSGGDGPAHLSVDATGRVLLCANYGSGTVAACPIHEDGSLGVLTFEDAPGEKAHQIRADPSNRWVFATCLGSDLIAQYALDVAHARLTRNSTSPSVRAPDGSGPRHLAFHPHQPAAFVIHELHNTVTPHVLDAKTGTLTPGRAVSALPPDFKGESTAAAIRVHPNGRFLFVSCRGPDTLATLEVADDGQHSLLARSHQPTGGKHPRSFALSEDGGLMLVANMHSDSVHALAVDASTGALKPLGEVAQVPEPAFVAFWRPPGQ